MKHTKILGPNILTNKKSIRNKNTGMSGMEWM